MEIAKLTYVLTSRMPPTEVYGLTNQMRRCAVSIPSNIAEGSQRGTDRDFRQFLYIAKGSLAELETQATLATDLGYLPQKEVSVLFNCIIELSKMLRAFIAKISTR